MNTKETAQQQITALKSLDFVAWRVNKAKTKLHKREVDRQLSLRPRLRRVEH